MTDMLWAAVPGFGLGTLYFGGLWWTVHHAADFRRPALVLLASALLRIGAMLGGLYLVGDGAWRRMLLYLLGFLLARLAVTWATRLPPPTAPAAPTAPAKVHHAP